MLNNTPSQSMLVTDLTTAGPDALTARLSADVLGVYDLANDEGWVSVGDTADTATFAVEAIRRWWDLDGSAPFP